MEGGHFLVGKESVRHPDLGGKVGAHHQLGDAGGWLERQAIVFPDLTEIKIGREVLRVALAREVRSFIVG